MRDHWNKRTPTRSEFYSLKTGMIDPVIFHTCGGSVVWDRDITRWRCLKCLVKWSPEVVQRWNLDDLKDRFVVYEPPRDQGTLGLWLVDDGKRQFYALEGTNVGQMKSQRRVDVHEELGV